MQAIKIVGITLEGEVASLFGESGCYEEIIWQDGRLEAKCLSSWYISAMGMALTTPCLDVPGENCWCGIYSCKSLTDLAVNRRYTWCDSRYLVLPAVVNVWGKVIPCEKGYRSQFASIEALIEPICYMCAFRGHLEPLKATCIVETSYLQAGRDVASYTVVCEKHLSRFLVDGDLSEPIPQDWINRALSKLNIPLLKLDTILEKERENAGKPDSETPYL